MTSTNRAVSMTFTSRPQVATFHHWPLTWICNLDLRAPSDLCYPVDAVPSLGRQHLPWHRVTFLQHATYTQSPTRASHFQAFPTMGHLYLASLSMRYALTLHFLVGTIQAQYEFFFSQNFFFFFFLIGGEINDLYGMSRSKVIDCPLSRESLTVAQVWSTGYDLTLCTMPTTKTTCILHM